jgi:hypothetical protein
MIVQRANHDHLYHSLSAIRGIRTKDQLAMTEDGQFYNAITRAVAKIVLMGEGGGAKGCLGGKTPLLEFLVQNLHKNTFFKNVWGAFSPCSPR